MIIPNRFGIGYDIHPLITNRNLVLGGVVIPFYKGLDGHSDGDVLLHAIIDALLGAAVIGDIGTNFPSDVLEYSGIESILLLEKTLALLTKVGWQPIHIDATIIAQEPLLSPYILPMRQVISKSTGMYNDSPDQTGHCGEYFCD